MGLKPKQVIDSNESHALAAFRASEPITNMEFSQDSKLLLFYSPKRSLVEIRALFNQDWFCKIDESSVGLVGARFVPDSKQVMVFSDFQLKLSIYNLCNKRVAHINNPKYHDKGYQFTKDGKFLAIAERKEAKDYIGIYYSQDWKLVSYFPVDTFDLQDLSWSPDNSVISATESCLEYKLLMYSPSNSLMCRHQAYFNGLGIRTMVYSKNGSYLAVGAYDEKIRLYNVLTAKFIIELEHQNTVKETPDCVVYREIDTLENLQPVDLQQRSTTCKNPSKCIVLICSLSPSHVINLRILPKNRRDC